MLVIISSLSTRRTWAQSELLQEVKQREFKVTKADSGLWKAKLVPFTVKKKLKFKLIFYDINEK